MHCAVRPIVLARSCFPIFALDEQIPLDEASDWVDIIGLRSPDYVAARARLRSPTRLARMTEPMICAALRTAARPMSYLIGCSDHANGGRRRSDPRCGHVRRGGRGGGAHDHARHRDAHPRGLRVRLPRARGPHRREVLLSDEAPPEWRYEFAAADGAQLLRNGDMSTSAAFASRRGTRRGTRRSISPFS